ncbi:thiamine phosphate synthase [Deinococcus aquiradiocola]|uniref:Thiamine-phosphate synthase n=1 Tax=Deinococcus aquiradiocola TaxID=393059 RepID=A0A917PBE1_9DEIO|nr:thiamine phosphate synthase [Deinococcus aquiradiocola]GGJ69745.1 hypothetical protein GCM10008939_12640 [Deinococcus aquiradiocola]
MTAPVFPAPLPGGPGRLYLVATPRPELPEDEFVARVEAALDGGVDTLQLRCKDTEAVPYLALAARLRPLCERRGVPLYINDRPDVAAACGATGVHLGQGDLPPAFARALAPHLQVGRSTHAPAQALAALQDAPAYVAVGPVHATPTKPGRAAAGLDYVRWAARHVQLPWFAIGGIDAVTLPDVLQAGARRVAVVRAVLDAPDPARAADTLKAMLDAFPLAAYAQAATLTVNGEARPCPPGLTLHALLRDLNVDASRVAVAHNDDFHPGARVPDAPLLPGDVLDIVRVTVGG